MDQVVHEVQDNSSFALSPPPPSNSTDSFAFSLNKVSPSIMLIIIILAIIFLISSLLHFLVKFLFRPLNRGSDDFDNATALQGQLQQLFHLHDAGLDQSFIDTLPVFNYKEIIGVKNNPFDCSVCLCEFELKDKLRLLPDCSHAFHMECIDTWLMSHSTCPLCRANLLPDFSLGENNSILIELERTNSIARVSSHFEEEENKQMAMLDSSEKVVQVKLGNFKNVDFQEGEGSNIYSSKNDIDSRRCFSMGSFTYVLDETTALHVPIKKRSIKKSTLPLTQGHKVAMSECACDSTRDFNGFEAFRMDERVNRSELYIENGNEKKVLGGSASNKESFSMSKIWSRGKIDEVNFAKDVDISRRAFSEIDIGRWECEAKTQSLSRTFPCIMGRQSKVVHSSFSSNL